MFLCIHNRETTKKLKNGLILKKNAYVTVKELEDFMDKECKFFGLLFLNVHGQRGRFSNLLQNTNRPLIPSVQVLTD